MSAQTKLSSTTSTPKSPFDERVRLFVARDEYFNLAAPLVLGCFGLVAFFLGLEIEFESYRTFSAVFTNVLLFNVSHNAFSYLMILYLPEMHSWLRSKSKWQQISLWCQGIGVYALILAMIMGLDRKLAEHISAVDFRKIWMFALLFFPVHHGIKQWIGLSSTYDHILLQNKNLDPEEKRRWALGRKIERTLFFMLFAWGISPLFPALHRIFLYFTLLVAALLTLNSYFVFPRGNTSNKTFFLTRIFFVPLLIASPFGMFAISAAHGIEYYYVWKKMRSQSAYKETPLSATVSLLFVGVIVIICLASPTNRYSYLYLENFIPGNDGAIRLLGQISLSFGLFHYYVDRQIFRMKDDSVRKNIGPLLIAQV